MKKLFVVLFIFTAAFSFAQQNVSAPQKYALVIGNGNYAHTTRLNNPVNDANDMAAALQGLGFTVDKVLDGTQDQMVNAVMQLKRRLSASRNSYGFLFYAGHGVQSGGENFLIPVDANIPGENFLRNRSVSVQEMLDELNEAGNEFNIVVLDACRDNPFSWKRSGTRGLIVVGSQPADSIIVFATAAGSTASDGAGRNGLFTQHLLNNIKMPGLEVTEVFRRTGADVARASNNEQRPAVYNQFYGTAYLGSRPSATPTPVAQPIPDGLAFEIIDGKSVTITKYIGNATTINIPERIQGLPVTSIGAAAFYNNNHLTSITIPSSVTAIGDSVFDSCSSLTNITIPSSVTSIGRSAFDGCSSLTGISVDSRNPSYASIDGVLFDKSIRTLIKYPMGKTARTYTIPPSVISIGDWAFNGTNLTSVTIPSSVTSIGDWAFAHCYNLTSVTIPSSVTSIGDVAFANCWNLTSITIPPSVTFIDGNVFFYCRNLTNITVDSRNTAYISVDGVLFDKNMRTIIAYPIGKTATTYTIPSSVISIGDWAFNGSSNLTSVTIPSSVTSIGYGAFSWCTSLTSIAIPSSVTSIRSGVFMSSGLTSVTLSRRTQVGENAFPETARIVYRD